MKNKYTAAIRRTPRGWWIAKCVEIPGAMTQGRTKAEAKENLKDAIQQISAEEDLESLSLSTDPDFLGLLARSRARYKAEGGIPHAEMCRRLGLKHTKSVTAP